MSSEQQGRNETRPNFPHDFDSWERVEKISEFAFLGTTSTDPILRSIGFRLLDSLAAGKPEEFFKACGITGHGGDRNTRSIILTHQRNTALEHLYVTHPEFRDLAPLDAARAMINSFVTYEVRKWPRERKKPYARKDGLNDIWHWMLRSGMRMPRTAAHIAQHFRKKSEGPLDFSRGRS